MFYEYVEGNPSYLNNRGVVRSISNVGSGKARGEAYASMFGFEKAIIDHLRVTKGTLSTRGKPYPNGTVRGYKGKYNLKVLWFDVDKKGDLEGARQTALKLISTLTSKYRIPLDSIYIYFSGNKGFHIGLHSKMFGGFDWSKDLPEIIGRVAFKIVSTCYEVPISKIKEELKGSKKPFRDIDLSIYNQNRIFRLPNSVHPETDLFKVPLSYDELSESEVEQILEFAEQPRRIPMLPSSEMYILLELQKNYSDSKGEFYESPKYKDGFGGDYLILDEVQPSTFFQPSEEGGRNNTLFSQACMLFEKTAGALPESVVYQLMINTNDASTSPLDDTELKKVITSAMLRMRQKGRKEKKTYNINSFRNLVPTYVKAVQRSADSSITLGFEELDKQVEGFSLEGTVIAVVAEAGCYKSLFLQQIGAKNAFRGRRSKYDSMEMSERVMVDRAINQALEPDFFDTTLLSRETYTKTVRQGIIDNDEETIRTLNEIMDNYSDNTLLDSTGSLNKRIMTEALAEAQEKFGKVHLEFVDGISMMESLGDENRTLMEHSKGLKEYAIENDMLIMPICHVPKETSLRFIGARDLSYHMRGTSKQRDNFDGVVSLTKIKIPSSSDKNPKFYKGVVCVHFYPKRFNGEETIFILQFNPNNLRLEPNGKDLSYYIEDEDSEDFLDISGRF